MNKFLIYKSSYLGQMLLKLSEIWYTHLVYPSETDKEEKERLKITYSLIIFNCKLRPVGNYVFLVSPTKSIEDILSVCTKFQKVSTTFAQGTTIYILKTYSF